MVGYVCDRCKKLFDWYENVYDDPKFQDMPYEGKHEYQEKHKRGEISFWETPNIYYKANGLSFVLYEPIIGDCEQFQADIKPTAEENGLVMLCPDCMRAFMKDFLGWKYACGD